MSFEGKFCNSGQITDLDQGQKSVINSQCKCEKELTINIYD